MSENLIERIDNNFGSNFAQNQYYLIWFKIFCVYIFSAGERIIWKTIHGID